VFLDVSALVGADDAAGPVHQVQIGFEVEQNAGLPFVDQSVLEGWIHYLSLQSRR